MAWRCCGHGFVASPDGRFLYTVGGFDGVDVLDRFSRYELCEGVWSELGGLPVAVGGNAAFCYWNEDDLDQYCVCSIGNAHSTNAQFMIFNVSMKELAFDMDRWSIVDIEGSDFCGYWKYTQFCQLRCDDGIVVCNDGGVYGFKIAEGSQVTVSLKKLSAFEGEPFGRNCTFGLSHREIIVLGDQGQLHKIAI